jgi:hypothetical protein
MRRVLLSLLALVVLAACAPAPPRLTWTKGGSTAQDFKRDNYACVQESRTSWSGGGTGLVGALAMESAKRRAQEEANRLYRMCMEARDWTATESDSSK